MMARDRLKTTALKNKLTILMGAYRPTRNKANSLYVERKRQYFTTKNSECKGNMKESEQTVNELLSQISNSLYIDCLKISESVIVHKKAFSKTINNFSVQLERS